MTITQILSDIKARAEAATPGPWDYWGGSATFAVNAQREPYKSFRLIGNDTDVRGMSINPAGFQSDYEDNCPSNAGIFRMMDAKFIAHARTDVPKLVEALTIAMRVIGEPTDEAECKCVFCVARKDILSTLSK